MFTDAFGNAIGNSIVGHIQERENTKNLQEQISKAFSGIKVQGAENLTVGVPNLDFVMDRFNAYSDNYAAYSSDYEIGVTAQLNSYNMGKSIATSEGYKSARTRFDNYAAESASKRAEFREQMSVLRNRRLEVGKKFLKGVGDTCVLFAFSYRPF